MKTLWRLIVWARVNVDFAEKVSSHPRSEIFQSLHEIGDGTTFLISQENASSACIVVAPYLYSNVVQIRVCILAF